MQTSLRGISNRAAKDKAHRFGNLYGLLDENFLKWCFWQLKRDAVRDLTRKLQFGRFSHIAETAIKSFFDKKNDHPKTNISEETQSLNRRIYRMDKNET